MSPAAVLPDRCDFFFFFAPVSQWLQGSILTDPKDFPWNSPDAAHRARAPVALALLMLFPAEVAWLLRYWGSSHCKSVNKWKPEAHVYVAVCSQLVIYGILSRDVNSVIKGSQLILSGVVQEQKPKRVWIFRQIKNQKAFFTQATN